MASNDAGGCLMHATTKSGAPLTFAELWERNERLDVENNTIIVTRPNSPMAEIHDRMPVILAPDVGPPRGPGRARTCCAWRRLRPANLPGPERHR